MVSEQKIREYIKNRQIENIFVYDSIDSTNTEAKRIAKKLYESGKRASCLFVAKEQTAGSFP